MGPTHLDLDPCFHLLFDPQDPLYCVNCCMISIVEYLFSYNRLALQKRKAYMARLSDLASLDAKFIIAAIKKGKRHGRSMKARLIPLCMIFNMTPLYFMRAAAPTKKPESRADRSLHSLNLWADNDSLSAVLRYLPYAYIPNKIK